MFAFPLDVAAPQREQLAALLSHNERERAARFHAPVHRERFVVAHARLRETLASTLGARADALEFESGAHGKPRLGGALAGAGLEFNLSHSAGVGLIGWAWRRAIGVDVEVWRRIADEAALAHRYFSAHEVATYDSLDPALRTEGFFNAWSRKEAYVKAVGRGLSLPLRSFDVSLRPLEDARLLRTSDAGSDGGPWSLAALPGFDQASAAVVLEADVCHLLPWNCAAVAAVRPGQTGLNPVPHAPISG